MRTQKKAFDCVTMKEDIQRRMLAQWRGMSDAEITAKIESDLASLTGTLGAFRRRMLANRKTTDGAKLRLSA